jgi:hypothetical protein
MTVRKKLREMLDHYELMQEDRRIELRMYKVRWIWYHTILAIELGLAIYVLYSIDQKLGMLL